MKRILTLLVLFFLAWQSFGQIREKNIKKERYDFQHKIDSLIYFIQQYDTLTPFSDRAELIDSLNNEITSRLLFVLNDKSVLNYQIESLFKEHLIFVSKSADKKIYLLSFDEKTGGSNRTNTTIIHYRPAN